MGQVSTDLGREDRVLALRLVSNSSHAWERRLSGKRKILMNANDRKTLAVVSGSPVVKANVVNIKMLMRGPAINII